MLYPLSYEGATGEVSPVRRIFRLLAFTGVIVLIAAVAWPVHPGATYPHALGALGVPTGPSSSHLLGVDPGGRDELARIVRGARTALAEAGAGALLALLGGAAVALLARFSKPAARFVLEVTGRIPAVLAGLLVAVCWFGRGPDAIVVAVAVGGLAAGAAAWRAGVRSLLPAFCSLLARGVLLASTLSFLGLGGAAPSWGGMIGQAGSAVLAGVADWWGLIFPGLAIVFTAGVLEGAAGRLGRASGGVWRSAAGTERSLWEGLSTPGRGSLPDTGVALAGTAAAAGIVLLIAGGAAFGGVLPHLAPTVSLLAGAVVLCGLAGAVAALLPSASTRLVPLRRLPAIVPGFWLALVALWLFASDVGRIPLLPGRGTYVGLTADPSGWLRSLLLGWIVLALAFVAGSPAGGQEDLAAGRSRWARAQGLRWTVAYRRRLRAAATRIAGVPASQLAAVFGAVVAIEVAFRIPGLGETAERGMRDGHRGQVAAVIVTALAALAIRELLRVLIAVRRGTER